MITLLSFKYLQIGKPTVSFPNPINIGNITIKVICKTLNISFAFPVAISYYNY